MPGPDLGCWRGTMRVMSRPTPRLKRALGPALLAVLVVGDVLGAGIYILIGEVAGEVGGLVWLAFAVAFVVAMLSALSYTELVAAHPHAAGSAHYARLAFDKPLVTFIMGFVVTCSAVTTCAAVSRAVGGQYLSEFVEWPVAAVAVGTIVVLALITWIGIAESARLNAVMTVVEVSGLVLVLAAGVMAFVDGSAEPARLTDVGGTDPGALGILAAAALAFFAFLGFEDVVHLSEEVKDPRRTFPRAMLIGMTVVALLYLGVAVAAAVLVEPSVLAGSDAPLLDALAASPIPVSPKAFAVVAMIAVTNTALLALVTASRQIYGLAEDGDLPRVLRGIGRRQTPTPGIIAAAVLAAALAVTGEVRDLAETTVALLLAVFASVNVMVLLLRRSPDTAPPPGSFRTPTWAPVVGSISAVVLLVNALADGGVGLFVRIGVLLAVGAVTYALARWLESRESTRSS